MKTLYTKIHIVIFLLILINVILPINCFCQIPPTADLDAIGPPAEPKKVEEEFICAFFCSLILPAEFIGGSSRWRAYLTKHLRYPDKAVNAEIQGSIKVMMVVGKNGRVKEAKALNSLGGGLENEAVRVILNSPKWKPAEQNGFKTSYRFIQTITFQLDDDDKKKHQKKAIDIRRKHYQSAKKTNLLKGKQPVKKSVSDILSTDYDFITANPSAQAQFPGGADSFKRYIDQHAMFPHQEAEGCRSVEIHLKFMVTNHGNVTDVAVLNDVGGGFTAEAIRLMMKSPKWKPAETGGQKVNYRMVEKLHFTIADTSNSTIGPIKKMQPCDAESPSGFW